jgi:hypothetical protein
LTLVISVPAKWLTGTAPIALVARQPGEWIKGVGITTSGPSKLTSTTTP